MYKEVTFADRTEWLNWRHQGIGSSDACVIMGKSKFKDYGALLSEKTRPVFGEDQTNSYIKDRGNKIETLVRRYFEQEMGTTFSSMNTESLYFPFQRASLDGITPDKCTIIEIKLLSSVNPSNINKKAAGYIKWEKAFYHQEVPEEYYPQLQHQLMVTGAEKCLFLGFKETKGQEEVLKEALALVEVKPDKEYIEHMAVKQCDFWWRRCQKVKELQYKGELE